MAMPGDTATIRVTRQTRDLLAEQAQVRGVSLSAMLSEIAWEHARASALRSEREAGSADAISSAALEEERDWDATSGDGIA
jgi:hypothetical protein